MTTTPTTAERLEKLEKEHRNLLARLEKLEKGRGSVIWAAVRLTALLVVVVFLLHYMGLLPRELRLERLPLNVKTLDAESGKVERLEVNEVILTDRSNAVRARLAMEEVRGKDKEKEKE